MNIDYDCLPEHMQQTAKDYIEHGLTPGGFFHAVLANDLLGAITRADHINRASIGSYHDFLVTIPNNAHGSYEAVEAWCKSGGIKGDPLG